MFWKLEWFCTLSSSLGTYYSITELDQTVIFDLYFSGYKCINFEQGFFFVVGKMFQFTVRVIAVTFWRKPSRRKWRARMTFGWQSCYNFVFSLAHFREFPRESIQWRQGIEGTNPPLRAFHHIWRWMAKLSRNDDVIGRGRAGPPHRRRTARWWRHSDAAVAREEEETQTTRWLRKEIRVT